MTGLGIVIAIALSAAALIVALVRPPEAPSEATASIAATPVGDTSAADKALCEKVAPLLRQMVDDGRRFVALGDPGTHERDAGIPNYRTLVENWMGQIQPLLDASSDPPRYLTRTLQSTIDFKRLYAENIRPGTESAADAETWSSGATAYGGPWEVCHALGVTW